MPNATPPAPPTTENSDESDDLFDLSRLVASAAPPAIEDTPTEERISHPVDSIRVAAPRVKSRPIWRRRGAQAVAAFAAGGLMALAMSVTGGEETAVAVASPPIEPEGAIARTKAAATARPAAAPTVVALEAPVHIAVDSEEEAETSAPTPRDESPRDEARAASAEVAPAEVAEESTVEVSEEAPAEEEATETETETETEAAPETESVAPEPAAVDSANASMGELLDHAVSHLDELELPTHGGEEATPTPEPTEPETAAPTGPSREDVQRVMEGLHGAVLECAEGGAHGLTHIQVTITPEGRTRGVRVTGASAGSPQGSCMARVARTARFPAFEGEAVTLRYPYRL